MSLNMGDISASVSVDVGQAVKALTSLQDHVSALEDELGRVKNGEVKVSAKVERSMQDAVNQAKDLQESLERAGKASDGVHAPQDMSRALRASREAAEGLASSLEQTGAAANKINAPTDISSNLRASAGAADDLASSLDRAGQEAEQLSSHTSSVSRVDGALMGLASTAKQLAPALGGAAAAGAVLSKGWSRVTAIDTASFKLKGLGHDAESTAQIMDSAMKAVKGTAYGFGDAASLAAGAVASGIKPGEELTRVLTTVSDSAAISGRSLNEMGAIFNKIAAQNRIQGDELNQLADAGIPVLQLLGEQMGVTAAEVRDMVSEGKVGFKEFEAAMRGGMGGAAQEMGQSIVGSLQNVGAAVGRLGASFITPFSGLLTNSIGSLTGVIDLATDGVSALTSSFGGLPPVVREVAGSALVAKGALVGLNTEAGQKLKDSLSSVGKSLGSAGGAVKQFGVNVNDAYGKSFMVADRARLRHLELADSAKAAALATGDSFGAMDHIMRQFGHTTMANINAVSARFRGFGAAVGSFATQTVSAVGTGLRGIVDLMGGPLGVALTAGTFAFSQMSQAGSRLDDAQQAIKASAEGAAEAQDALRMAVVGTSGALQGEGLAKGIEVAANSMTRFLEVGESYQNFLYKVDTDTSFMDRLNPFGEGAQQFADDKRAAEALRDSYGVLKDRMDEMGISKDGLNRIVAEGGPQFDALIGSLRESGPAGEMAASNLQKAAKEVQSLVEAGRTMPESMKLAADGVALLADAAGDADTKVEGMKKVLQSLGLMPTDLNEVMLEQAESIKKLREEIEGFGPIEGLFNADGMVDWGNADVRPVIDALSEMQMGLIETAAAGGNASEALAKMEPNLQLLQQQLGLTDEQMMSLREQFGLVDGQFYNATVKLEGASESEQELASLVAGLRDLPEGKYIDLKLEGENTAAALESIGAKVEDLGNGMHRISMDDTEIINAMGLLDMVGVQARDLPGGHIEITDTSDRAIANLRALGLEPREFDGKLVIDDNAKVTADNVRGMLEGLITHGQHIIDKVVRTSYFEEQGHDRATAGRIQGPLPPSAVMKRARGGLIPRLAIGGLAHGGYKLPTSGPGTEVQDGFLGVGADGVPTAWVDRGEFVVNGDSTSRFEPALWRLNADDPIGAIKALLGLDGFAAGGVPSGGSGGSKSSGGAKSAGLSIDGATVPLTPDMDGTIEGLDIVQQKLDVVGEGADVAVTADTAAATTNIDTFKAAVGAIPTSPAVNIKADTAQPVKNVQALGGEIGKVAGSHDVKLAVDSQSMGESVQMAVGQLAQLAETPTVAQAGLDTTALDDAADDGRANLEDLGSQNPVPVAGLDNSPLMSGVAESDAELNRVGSAKATSVSDVDNSSALANIQGVINELNKMPVERVIRVVAHGTDTALAGGGKVPGLATGGQVDGGYKLPTTGPGTGVVDGFLGVDGKGMPLVRVNAGEWVINDKRSEEYDKELAMINAGTFPKLDDIDRIPGYARGGVVSPDQMLSFARGNTVRGVTPPGSLEGSPYIWGGGLLANWGDCSGMISGLAALATGADVNGRKFATGNEGQVLASMGFRPGLGPAATSFNVGWFNGGPYGGHTAGTVGGTNVEMGGGRGNGQVGGPAAGASHPQFTDHAWLPLGEVVAFDYFRPLGNVTATRQQPGPGGYSSTGGFGVGLGGLGVGPGGAGVTLHDNGGWLEPGTFAYNGLGEPEPVLTPDKWRLVERMVDGQAAHWAAINKLIEVFPQFGNQLTEAGNAIDRAVVNMTKWSDTPAETATAWRSLAKGNLNYSDIMAAQKGHPMAGLGVNTRTIIGGDMSNQAISLARKAGYGAQAEHALDQEIVVNIAMSEQTIKAYEALEKAREDEQKAADDVLEAERKLQDAREKQVKDQEDAAKSIRDAEERLAEARREAGDVTRKSVEPGKDGQVDAEKAADADRKFADDQEKSAKKVRDAEEKLAEARAKQADKSNSGSESVVEAEEKLKQARANQAKAIARVVQAQTGLQVATVIAALEVVNEVSTRVSKSVVAGFEGAAAGAKLLVDAISTLGDNMKAVADLADKQNQQQLASITSAKNLMQAIQAQRDAERNQVKARNEGYRSVQQAEFDLSVARFEHAKNAGDSEINLAELRKKGIFDVHATASAADRLAIQSASDVATREANLANARALMDKANFDHTRQVATANDDLSHAQNLATIQAERLREASLALARAQAFATGEMGGQDALQRFLEGEQKMLDARAKQAAADASFASTINPLNWFKGPVSKGLELQEEARKLQMEGNAQAEAYREQAMEDLKRLNEDERKLVLEAMAKIKGVGGYTAGDVSTGFVSFLTGNSDLLFQKKSKESADALRVLNDVLTRSKYRIEAEGLRNERANKELDRREKTADVEFQLKQIEQLLEASPQEDYLKALVDLTEENKATLEQENKQLGTISGQLANKTTSTLMSIGGAGWGGAADVAGPAAIGGGFGGVSAADMSLWATARVEDAWLDGKLERALVPVADTLADAVAAGIGDRPLGLPDTVVDGYYSLPVEGAGRALSDAAQRSSDRLREMQETVAGMARDVRSMSAVRPVGTQYTGPVTVQSSKADAFVNDLAGAVRRA